MHTQGSGEWVPTRDCRRLFAMVLPGPEEATGPTVVFEAGSGASRSSWALVQPRVAEFARAIVYDRSGVGRSAPDPSGRTLARMAGDLTDLLDHFGPGPYLLVGHSAGGPIARLAASLRPELVAALVLVEPSDEKAKVLFGRGFRTAEWVFLRVSLLAARMGLLTRLYRRWLEVAPAADVRADLEREGFTPQVLRTQIAQSRTYLDELEAWQHEPPAEPPVPLTIISGERTGDGMSRLMRATANTAYAERAASSPYGRHVPAPNSSHLVPFTDPQLVVDEIRRLV